MTSFFSNSSILVEETPVFEGNCDVGLTHDYKSSVTIEIVVIQMGKTSDYKFLMICDDYR
jgi:hypothetical protein